VTVSKSGQQDERADILAAAAISHLRDGAVKKNLLARQTLVRCIREQLLDQDFAEFESPVLSERIDEYVSGRIKAQTSYGDELWLVQSPQFFKQLLMAAGFPNYFQFAHCFRDEPKEPGRFDRLREFIQVDIEMATPDAAEIRRMVERIFQGVGRVFGRDVEIPFPEIKAREAVETHGTDRPDLRRTATDWSFVWVVDFPLAARDQDGVPRLTRHPMARPTRIPADIEDACDIHTLSFDLVFNGYEIASGALRIYDAQEQRAILETMGLPVEQFQILIKVLNSTCPPHGGIGMGLDRLAMVITGETDIARVSAFPDWFGCVHRGVDTV